MLCAMNRDLIIGNVCMMAGGISESSTAAEQHAAFVACLPAVAAGQCTEADYAASMASADPTLSHACKFASNDVVATADHATMP